MQDNCSKLHLVPGFHIKELSHGSLMLLSEGDNYCIQDPLSAEIIKFLKDKETLVSLEDIHSRLQELGMSVPPEKLQKITQEMIKIPLVTSQKSSLPKNLQAFLFKIGVSPEVAEEKLKMQKVTVSSYSDCPASELEEILYGLGVQTAQEGAFHILIVDDYLDTRIQEFGLLAQRSNKPWMLVKPQGRSLWMGPIFRPDQPALASYESLALRLKENRSAEIDALGTASDHFNLPSLMALPQAKAIGLNIVAMETLKWIVSCSSGLISNILTFDCTDLNIQFHYIDIHPTIKNSLLPQTSSSDDASHPPIKLLLNSSKKTFFDDDGARTRSPEETWKYIEHLASPITGLMSKIIYKQQNNYHIYYGPRSLPHSTSPVGHIRSPEIVVGKSTNILKAKVGCIAEAIERYFCTDHQLHPQYVFAYQEIANDSIHPQVLLNFSPSQYAQRETTNAKSGPYQWVHRPFDETKKIHWLRLSSLNSSKESYIPSAYCYMNNNDRQEHLMCSGDSNGCACGNSLEEALFYGISEVIERDAVAIWWYNRLIRPTVDLDSFSNSAIKNIGSRIKAQGRCLRVIDITTDLGIPAFVAVSWKNDGSRIVFGTSAHLDPQIGIVRALGELHQMLTRADVSENIDISGIIPAEREVVSWLIHEKLEQHPFLMQENGKKRSLDYPVNDNEDFLDDLQIYFQKLQTRSLDVYAVNLTPVNSPMVVVKVIIPTMRHFWARYGKGRLYQVPVLQGDRLNPLKESELNPMPYFL
jgi:oxazoline/thiazoline synthase